MAKRVQFTVGKTVRFGYRAENGTEATWTLVIRHADKEGKQVPLIRGMAESDTESGYRSFRTERITTPVEVL